RGLEGVPTGDHRAGRHHLVEHLFVDAGEPGHGGFEVVSLELRKHPFMEAQPSITHAVVRPHVRAGEEAIRRHRHVENARTHRFTPSVAAGAATSCTSWTS